MNGTTWGISITQGSESKSSMRSSFFNDGGGGGVMSVRTSCTLCTQGQIPGFLARYFSCTFTCFASWGFSASALARLSLRPFLLPANKVWDKVMFLHISVILSMGGGGLCMISLPVWLSGPMFLLGESPSLVPCSFYNDRDPLDRAPGKRPPLDRDPPRDPLDSKEQAVCILLECIFVIMFVWCHICFSSAVSLIKAIINYCY